MKEIKKYVGYYLLVYLVVLAICGFFQYMSVCQGHFFSCAVSMSGINTIVTTTAYVLTPIVAIIGFLNWKQQHNKLILADEAKKLLIAINDDIRAFTDISSFFRNQDQGLNFKDVYNDDISKYIKNLSENSSKIMSKSMILYELNNDYDFFNIRNEYSFFMSNLERTIFNCLSANSQVSDILIILDLNRAPMMHNNKLYKRNVRKYILA